MYSGVRLAPRLLGQFGSQRGRYDSAGSLQQLAGCVPVTRKSGKSEAIYLASLIRHGSPAIEWMHSQKRPAPIEEEPLT